MCALKLTPSGLEGNEFLPGAPHGPADRGGVAYSSVGGAHAASQVQAGADWGEGAQGRHPLAQPGHALVGERAVAAEVDGSQCGGTAQQVGHQTPGLKDSGIDNGEKGILVLPEISRQNDSDH